jgi:hypothetical protein
MRLHTKDRECRCKQTSRPANLYPDTALLKQGRKNTRYKPLPAACSAEPQTSSCTAAIGKTLFGKAASTGPKPKVPPMPEAGGL